MLVARLPPRFTLGSLASAAAVAVLFFSALPLPTARAQGEGAGAESAVVPGLSQHEAEARAALVSDVSYDLHFDLNAAEPGFHGREVLDFQLKQAEGPLRLDFVGGAVARIEVNGTVLPATAAPHSGGFITIPAAALKVGENKLVLEFAHPYSQNGAGLYRFKDPTDGYTYLYTQFEAYSANRMFPGFDQPDLKAKFSLSVTAPQDWEIVSTTRETAAKRADKGRKEWRFATTQPISSYLFSLAAGPYHKWEDNSGPTPLRLFARQSLVKYVDAAEWFKYSQQGLAFYRAYFDFPYPFPKLDQLFVPDFNAGGMENVGAITYTEGVISRGVPTRAEHRGRASLVLHEIAHQWFGDLVTMRWWNDLWLNESFATYMSELALTNATEFKESWIGFAAQKAGAYRADQQVTTHPIANKTDNTNEAFTNFDAITYGKGASVLQQIDYALGPDHFRDGVRAYLKKFQYANATQQDFIAALAAAAGRDLSSWSRDWLETAGVNTLSADFSCLDGKIASFTLLQDRQDGLPTLRQHTTLVGLYEAAADGSLALKRSARVAYQGPSTVVKELIGANCPSFVYPNDGDHDYARVKLDDKSLAVAKTSLNKLPDPMLRLMVWDNLWNMVREGSWGVRDFAELLLAQASGEPDYIVLSSALSTVHGWRGASSLIGYLPSSGKGGELRAQFLAKAAKLFETELVHAVPGGDRQQLWYNNYVDLAGFPEAKIRTADILSGKWRFNGLTIDQDRRWSLIHRLSESGAKDAAKLREAELKRDGNESGQLAAIAASAVEPSPANKDHWYKIIVDPGTKYDLAQLKAAMHSLFPDSQRPAREMLATTFYTDLLQAVSHRDEEYVGVYAGTMAPATCTQASVDTLAQFLAKHADLPPMVLKTLKVIHQEDERCVRIQASAASA